MKVILRENVDHLGRMGDIVNVADGYARNFLIPKKWVIPADEHNVAALQHYQRVLEKKREKRETEARGLAERLAQVSCTVKKKVGNQDKLFGSVTAAEVVDQLTQAGFSIDKRFVHFENPIKTVGSHPVQIRLDKTVTATLMVTVVAQE